MSFSPATVVDTFAPNPRLRRVRLRVEDPESLTLAPHPDCAVGVYFDQAAPNLGRTYSVRRQTGDLVDLDILVHPGGPGSTWAQTVRVGDRVGLDHARAWYRPPPSATWQLLVADLAGLPALARIMAESPPTVSSTVVVEVLDHDDLDYLPTPAGVTLIPSMGSGNGVAASQLAQLVGSLELPADGYCWFGGEAGASREVRKHLRGRGWTIDQYDVMGYWRQDSAAWDARFALVGDDFLAMYRQAIADGKSDKAAAEEFDDALERIGL
ncbi:siderophore-interacting protein [Mycolicibacterium aichiense]|uniref:Siderophore-interacting protein n=1 Tax=Mycolicibacterium aichiense TaxID=1799 RepID=A0AAD1MFC3_9MYCO|nr:siderophore-interacting protein [Mycolicibacterium aichiense]MCV7017102.1 siderophore-interacting protein [Mycolicibacterium aichiense]BBX10470.1 siderophore-interacting protein [Mycolicibacterium aichiense]STZ25871.1 siderophore-interacting protein [Mycolicibacterium aichiense]